MFYRLKQFMYPYKHLRKKNLLFKMVCLIWACAMRYGTIYSQIIHNYNTDNGLAQGFVSSVLQDKEGYIWASTHNGLSRFDGTNFKNYHTESGLHSNKIHKLLEDDQDRIWVINDETLQIFDQKKKRFSTPSYFKNQKLSQFRDAVLDQKKRLWILKSEVLLCFNTLPEEAAELLKHTLTIEIDTRKYGSAAAFFIQGDTILISCAKGLLFCTEKMPQLASFPAKPPAPPVQIWKDTLFGGLWFQTTHGAGRWYGGRLQWFPEINSSFYSHNSGVFWNGKTYIFGKHRVFEWNGQSMQCVIDQLPFEVMSTCLDKAGGLWTGTNAKGLFYLSLHAYPVRSFWNGRMIAESIYKDAQGRILSLIDKESKSIYTLKDQSNTIGLASAIDNFSVDEQGTVWYLRPDQTLQELGNGRRWSILKTRSSERTLLMRCLPGGSIVVVQKHRILFVHRQNGSTLTLDSIDIPWLKVKRVLRINSVKEDSAGNIWFGSDEGVLKAIPHWQAGKIESIFFNKAAALPDLEILALETSLQAEKGIWLGTLNGFYHFNPADGKLKHITTPQIAANEAVYCLQKDRTGVIWLGTNVGLKKYNPADSCSDWFNVSDGLPAGEFNRNTESISADGEILMGTVSGGIRFYPSEVKQAIDFYPIVISEILLNDTTINNLNNSKSINYITFQENNRLTLHFSLLEFFSPSNHQYRYRLRGSSDEWSMNSAAGSVTYAGLAPGTYTFEVCGTAGKSEWSTVAQLEIRVLPSPWKRFLQVLLIGSFGLFAFVWYWKKRRRINPSTDAEATALIPEVQRPVAVDTPAPTLAAFSDAVLALIEAHFQESDFNVLHIQEKLKISKAQLHRKMIAETGNTAAYFLKKKRLDFALELLQTRPDMTIAEIAYNSGFSDPNYFSTVFSANYGQSPKNYRKNET